MQWTDAGHAGRFHSQDTSSLDKCNLGPGALGSGRFDG